MTIKFKVAAAALALTVSACASNPGSIQPSYVPSSTYASMSCGQINVELQRVGTRLNQIVASQKGAATTDAIAVGVGLFVFWPALFLLAATPDQEAEIANLKGQYEALQGAARQKGC